MRYTSNGTAVTTIGLAVNNRYKKGDEWVDDPCFIDATAFGRVAETLGEHLVKGGSVLVEGRLKQENWETAEGQKRTKIAILIDHARVIYDKRQDKSRDEKPGNADLDCPLFE
jgi:single-strand DNA-binding protein